MKFVVDRLGGLSLNGLVPTLIEPSTPAKRAEIREWLDLYPALAAYVANVIPAAGSAHIPYVEWPTLYIARGVMELSWCNLSATFNLGANCQDDTASLIVEDHDWTDVDPAGRLMACH